jgi:DNA-binding MarR family transcriptional regulator
MTAPSAAAAKPAASLPTGTSRSAVNLEFEQTLADVIDRLGRALLHATRAAQGLPVLQEAQVTVLRLLVAAGPMSPARLADELRLARSTVSNLIRGLDEAGLVKRLPSKVDGRSVLIEPTGLAGRVLESFQRGRTGVIADALSALEPSQRAQVESALPALSSLVGQVDRLAERHLERRTGGQSRRYRSRQTGASVAQSAPAGATQSGDLAHAGPSAPLSAPAQPGRGSA